MPFPPALSNTEVAFHSLPSAWHQSSAEYAAIAVKCKIVSLRVFIVGFTP